MDIYQIWTTHNRPWSEREMICFGIIMLVCAICLIGVVCFRKIKMRQALAVLLLVVYLGIVFGSTVFTRMPTVRQYELLPFWSWREVLQSNDKMLLQENLLNCLLLVPMGMLLPIIMNHRVRLAHALLAGVMVSVAIELCQLIFMRGLFEWDDMIHNGLGCMLGCCIVNFVIKWISKFRKKNFG